jgi:hypothetical protein
MRQILLVPQIPEYESGAIEPVREALVGGIEMHLVQSWFESTEPDFQPGSVKIGVSANRLVILAELEDKWIHNPATQMNELAFLCGDTFEMFLKAEHREDYWELHVTPDNVVLQLHYPRHIEILGQEAKSAGRSLEMGSWHVWEKVMTSQVLIRPGRWTVLAEISLDIFGANDGDLILQANFSRYDYLPDQLSPVLSATAVLGHPPNFHDQSGWSLLRVSLPHRDGASAVPIEL